MPMSSYVHLEKIVALMVKTKPTTFLDVGIGFGKWGCLAREYVEGWCNHRYIPGTWKTLIHGIEIYEPYRNPLWGAYDKIIIGNVLEVTKNPDWDVPRGGYDFVLMMDVLEHIDKDVGLQVLKQLCSIGKKVVFSFSNNHQRGVCANTHEDHISRWKIEDFKDFLPTVMAECPYKTWGILIIG
jgi:hypothetical protein